MKKITWCGVAQSPYNDYLLAEVSKAFDLKVYYKIREKGTHPWQLKSVAYDLNYIQGNLFQALNRVTASDIVVVSGWSFWQYIIIMLIPMKSVKKVYWTDTPDLNKKDWSGPKGLIRRGIVKMVFEVFDEVWSTGKPGCYALEKLGCDKRKIRSFPFFLDLTRYSNIDAVKSDAAWAFKKKNSNPGTGIIFLCMGQLASKKRFEDAIKALALLKDDSVVLWIAGTGPQEKELMAVAAGLNILRQVKFLGWLQQDDVELAYIAADIFVHPAEFDPFPTVVLDAMTWGKPVIGTDVSGSVADRVVDGVNGFIFSTGQVEMLAGHMQFFISNRPAIKTFGMESRKTACGFPVSWGIKRLNEVLN